jgi:hypothetical protein
MNQIFLVFIFGFMFISSGCSMISSNKYLAVSKTDNNLKTKRAWFYPCGGPNVNNPDIKDNVVSFSAAGATITIDASSNFRSRPNWFGPFYFPVIPMFFFGYGQGSGVSFAVFIESNIPIEVNFKNFKLNTDKAVFYPQRLLNTRSGKELSVDQPIHLEKGEETFFVRFAVHQNESKTFELLLNGFSSLHSGEAGVGFFEDTKTFICVGP